MGGSFTVVCMVSETERATHEISEAMNEASRSESESKKMEHSNKEGGASRSSCSAPTQEFFRFSLVSTKQQLLRDEQQMPLVCFPRSLDSNSQISEWNEENYREREEGGDRRNDRGRLTTEEFSLQASGPQLIAAHVFKVTSCKK
ncbi:hypothetical protein NQZ68_019868 [Dissostichus eleginoides]|nr:hypothetical protein NQZ68_019868 [Dissostichus eleginoides]